MGRTVRWVTGAVVALAAVVAGPAAAQDFYIQQDYRVVEGVPSVTITIVRTFNSLPTTVFWRTVDGSAVGGSDFTPVASGSVSFASLDVSKSFNVTILNDAAPEPSPASTLPDEVFFVELTGLSGVGAILDGRATVTIVDDDRVMPGAQFLTVVSDGTLTSGRNRLQWRVPAEQSGAPQFFHVRWKSGAACATYPASTTDGGGSGNITALAPGSVQTFTHNVPTPHDLWCYSIFTLYPTQSAEIAQVKAKTFDSNAGPLKWTYTNSAAWPNVAPPTIGPDGIYTVDNDGVLHAMLRGGANAGAWPPLWNPVSLGRIAHNRSPVVPLPFLGSRLFIGTEDGELHSVDGRTGFINWSRKLLPGLTTGTQAPPALLLKGYGGSNDLLLVGTTTSANNAKFFALNPVNGAPIDEYPNGTTDTPPGGKVENVLGMPVVDYAGNRVYFGTTGVDPTGYTVWSLDLGSPAPDLTLASSLAWNPKPLGTAPSTIGTMGSLVLRNNWLYLGTGGAADSEVHALCIADGTLHSYRHGDGQANGFTWPDRRNGRLYFSTANRVHAVLHDSTLGPDPDWILARGGDGSVTMMNPSIVLQRPGTDELYVGDGQGRLVRLDARTGAQMGVVTLDSTPGTVIGAPSLDNGTNPALLLVGSDKGVIYAVQAGF